MIEVIDNGLGIDEDRPGRPVSSGIGLRNVNERLRVIFGAQCQLGITSAAGHGTRVRLELPQTIVPTRRTA